MTELAALARPGLAIMLRQILEKWLLQSSNEVSSDKLFISTHLPCCLPLHWCGLKRKSRESFSYIKILNSKLTTTKCLRTETVNFRISVPKSNYTCPFIINCSQNTKAFLKSKQVMWSFGCLLYRKWKLFDQTQQIRT